LITLNIITHSGKEYETEVDNYDPVKINEDTNNLELNTVLIGDVILSRIDVKGVCKKSEI
jgi:hypothetical protein